MIRLSQHGPAQKIGEPYVYTYYYQDYEDMLDKVARALDTPIDRYIPHDMRVEYVDEQLRRYLDRDVSIMFQRVVKANGNAIPPPPANATERCRELDICPQMITPGRHPASPGRAFHWRWKNYRKGRLAL
jgi:hypothetical protein